MHVILSEAKNLISPLFQGEILCFAQSDMKRRAFFQQPAQRLCFSRPDKGKRGTAWTVPLSSIEVLPQCFLFSLGAGLDSGLGWGFGAGACGRISRSLEGPAGLPCRRFSSCWGSSGRPGCCCKAGSCAAKGTSRGGGGVRVMNRGGVLGGAYRAAGAVRSAGADLGAGAGLLSGAGWLAGAGRYAGAGLFAGASAARAGGADSTGALPTLGAAGRAGAPLGATRVPG
jgi:hypothetical protein